jgi:D-alanyl-D-alanine dipeptidase
MPRSFGEPLTKLRAVPIHDNGEPLVDPTTLSRRIRMATEHPKFGLLHHVPHVRQTVAVMLARAADSLPDGIGIEIVEGYRGVGQQRIMYDTLMAEFAAKHPQWNRATLTRYTNQLCAPPGDRCPPPHTTGGAVDLCLVSEESGERLDMTSPFEWDEKCAPTRLAGLSEFAQANRNLLIETLSTADLTNYAGEWWHWSYGDSGWALRTGASVAIYGQIADGVAPRP